MIDGRKVAIGFCIIAVLGCVVYGNYRIYGWYLGTTANLKAAAEPALVALAAKEWDIVGLVPFATPSLNELIKKPETATVFTKERALESVEQFLGAQGVRENYPNGKWTATLDEQVRFAQGTGSAHFILYWLDNDWRVDGVYVRIDKK